ncbi:NPC intracellular cholesterol transporter 2 [Nephila pilipes]|uniref:NPC intracellular cholesterol transporter 2 n=1 Tax=Nephila pilipes TaxID=299642 RepID=A0A8X6TWH2_NEPPI|nr:NPC intracellular cholesterol transporter 2 [Nephila pilipes]
MNRLVACFAVFVLAAQVSGTKFKDCGSTTGQVKAVEVTDCPDSEDTCILKRGSTKGITIKFASKTGSKSVKTVIHGVIEALGNLNLPFPLPRSKSDGCKSGLACPLKNGENYVYNNSLDVKSFYPPFGVTVRWELKGDDNSDIVCIEIPCQIE